MFRHMLLKIAVADPGEEPFLKNKMSTKKLQQVVGGKPKFSNPYAVAPTFVNLRPKFIDFPMLGIDFGVTNRQVISPLEQGIDGLFLHRL